MIFSFSSIFLISVAAIGFEILLMRILSIIQWSHLAFLIISLTLLGYSASGTFLALINSKYKQNNINRTTDDFNKLFIINSLLFSLCIPISYSLVGTIPLNMQEIVWNWHQIIYLAIYYLVLATPFFFAANCIGLAFIHFQNKIPKIYFADLSGAALGALLIFISMSFFHPLTCIKLLSIIAFIAPFIIIISEKKPALFLLTLVIIPIIFMPQRDLEKTMTEFKDLSKRLMIPETKILQTHFNSLGYISLVESPTIPFRYMPGLSLNYQGEIPKQKGVFVNGNFFSPLKYDPFPSTNLWFDFIPSSLLYQLQKSPRLLILEFSGDKDITVASSHGAASIDIVSANNFILETFYVSDPQIRFHFAESRSFIAKSDKKYDIIQIPIPGNVFGGFNLDSNYLYTVNALEDYLQHLQEDGIVSIERWIRIPPRDSLKLFNTAVKAMRSLNAPHPEKNLILIRTLQTTMLLIKNKEFTARDIKTVYDFCQKRSYDIAYIPDSTNNSTNQFNLLRTPYFAIGTTALLSDDENIKNRYIKSYNFNIDYSTDQRPNFGHYFKWKTANQLLSHKSKASLALLDWEYPMIVIALILALLFGLGFIIVPLMIFRIKQGQPKTKQTIAARRFLSYFLLIGLAFLFIEISFIEKFTLFIGNPLYSVMVILGSFLFFAGLGSNYSHQYRPTKVLMTITFITLSYAFLLSPLLHLSITIPTILKVLLTIILIAPLAFHMGMPFPLGLSRIASLDSLFVPWSWGINGLASVLSAITTSLLIIHFGHQLTVVLAALLYFLAFLIWRFIDNKEGYLS